MDFLAAASTHEPFGLGNSSGTLLEQILSNQLLLAVSGPSYNFSFSVTRFVQFMALFLCPFLSLPHVPLCPLRVDGLDLEREYVVSGAALRADFELPTWEVYVGAVGIILLVAAGAAPHGMNFALEFQSVFSLSDIVVPTTLILLFALLQAAYQSFHRSAHALERLDRHHFPRLAALSAQCVDANCHTLVLSWDEEGLGRVVNRKYMYKWALLALLNGFLLAFAAPLTRIIRGQHAFAEYDGSGPARGPAAGASAVLSFCSVWVVCAGITYQLWRIIDLERQLQESVAVITRCAYLKGQSIIRPADNRKFKFFFDAPVTMDNIYEGVLGWYITRSFVLYASTLSNHRSRHAWISVLTLAAVSLEAAVIADAVRSLNRGSIVFTTAHGFAVVAILGWCNLLMYFLNLAKNIDTETRKHLYLVDVAGIFHLFRDPQGASVIARCRGMIAEHDYRSMVLGVQVTERVYALAWLYHGLATACMILTVVMWVMQLRGTLAGSLIGRLA